jgi:hypothetical protein
VGECGGVVKAKVGKTTTRVWQKLPFLSLVGCRILCYYAIGWIRCMVPPCLSALRAPAGAFVPPLKVLGQWCASYQYTKPQS